MEWTYLHNVNTNKPVTVNYGINQSINQSIYTLSRERVYVRVSACRHIIMQILTRSNSPYMTEFLRLFLNFASFKLAQGEYKHLWKRPKKSHFYTSWRTKKPFDNQSTPTAILKKQRVTHLLKKSREFYATRRSTSALPITSQWAICIQSTAFKTLTFFRSILMPLSQLLLRPQATPSFQVCAKNATACYRETVFILQASLWRVQPEEKTLYNKRFFVPGDCAQWT